MNMFKVKDGTQIYYKDWGVGRPIMFHHAFPLSSDEWDPQLVFFLQQGFRVIAHDRRGHGRSTQTDTDNDMDTYAADVAELAAQLDLRDAVHVGHSTGGGEVARYVSQHGKGRVAKAVLLSSVVPLVLKSAETPDGVPVELLDQVRAGIAANRSHMFKELSDPYYGYNRPSAKISQAARDNWWRQGMMGGIKAQYDCVRAFSETDFTEDLKNINVPTLVMQGDDDQCVPYRHAAKAAKLLKHSTLKIYPGLPHGMPMTNADQINADLLAFIQA
jgi:non-heme chloroperoxidase